MADINLSLDEIIKKRYPKNTEQRRNAPPLKRLAPAGPRSTFPKKVGVVDARQKLNKIRRAVVDGPRGAVADARYRLEALKKRKARRPRPLLGNIGGVLRRTVPGVARDFDKVHFDIDAPSSPTLLRTFDNDLNINRAPFSWDSHKNEDYDRLLNAYFDIPQQVISRQRIGGSNLQSGGFSNFGSFKDDEDQSWRDIRISVKNPTGTVGILKRTESSGTPIIRVSSRGGSAQTLSDRFHHDRNAEAAVRVQALKAQLKAAQGEDRPKSELGHRIVVSNLVHSVTHEDVQELFADIGELMSSKVVRPGVAEVVYRHYDDAVKAVDVYHNRQLDGQPMKCLLVKNNQFIPKKTKTVELDMATLRNALHKKPTS